jgi:hypothetical protein
MPTSQISICAFDTSCQNFRGGQHWPHRSIPIMNVCYNVSVNSGTLRKPDQVKLHEQLNAK